MDTRKPIPLSDIMSELIPDIGTPIGQFLTDNELTEFSIFTKDANTFFAGALQERARKNLIKYAFINRQDIIREILKRYPGIRHDKQLMLSLYLHHISFGQPNEALALLKEHPHFVNEYGTVITHSGHIIENVTGLQLAYALEDEDMGKKLWDCLDDGSKENANQQLELKIAEVEEQEYQFVDYDYTALVKAITEDEKLIRTFKARAETEHALAEWNIYFKQGSVKKGKPFNLRHLWKAYEVYEENWDNPWNVNQRWWYFQNVIDPQQNKVSTWYGQAFSEGGKYILKKGHPLQLNRSLQIKTNNIYEDKLFYFPGLGNSSLVKNRDFIVDIKYGMVKRADRVTIWPGTARFLKNLCRAKAISMEEFKKYCCCKTFRR